jgi:hypothetical protein
VIDDQITAFAPISSIAGAGEKLPKRSPDDDFDIQQQRPGRDIPQILV